MKILVDGRARDMTAAERAARKTHTDATAARKAAKAPFTHLPKRRAAYHDAILSEKNVPSGDEIDGLGFMIDAMMQKIAVLEAAIKAIDSSAVTAHAEYDGLVTAILDVKRTIPKPGDD